MSNDHEGAVERLRQDILDPQGVWRHCRVAMVNKYDTEEVVGFPSFTVDDLRTVLSALSASEAREHALLDCVNAVSAAIGTVRFMDPPDGGCTSLAEQVQRMREELEASEARLRVVVEALGDIHATPYTGPDWPRNRARTALATIEDKPHDH